MLFTVLPITIHKYLLLTGFAVCACMVTAQELNLLHFTSTHGLISNKCYNMTQDMNGFLWIATETGVSRFDGNNFTSFTQKNNGLGDNEILDLVATANGRVWFSGFNKTICYYSLAGRKVMNAGNNSLIAGLEEQKNVAGIIRSFFCDRTGALWLMYEKGQVIRIRNNRTDLFSAHCIRSAWETPAGMLVLADARGKLYKAGETGMQFKAQLPGFAKGIHEVTSFGNRVVVNDSGGRIFFYEETGPWQYRLQGTMPNPGYNKMITGNERFPGLWMITRCNGVLRFRSVEDLAAGKPMNHLLPGKCIRNVFFDREGNAWFISFSDGIYGLLTDKVTHIKTANMISNDAVTAVMAQPGAVWYGTHKGAVYKWTAGREKEMFIPAPNPNTQKRITCMLNENDGGTWLGADDALFYRNNQGNITTVGATISYAHPVSALKALVHGPGGRIYAGTCCGLYLLQGAQKTKPVQLYDKRITALCCEPGGTVWFASRDSLFIRTPAGIRAARWQPGAGMQISALAATGNGFTWVGTAAAGISILYNEEPLAVITEENEFPLRLTSNLCKKILPGKPGTFWISTNKGLNRVEVLSLQPFRYTVKTFTRSNGLANNDINDFSVSGEQVTVATPDGIDLLPAGMNGAVPPPVSYIGQTRLLTSPGNGFQNDTVFSFRNNNLVFDYTAISLSGLGGLLFQVRLEGYEKDWRTTTAHSIQYTSLPPGKYRFLVRASNTHGDWGAPAASSLITIKPAFYQTGLFRAGMVAIVLLLFAGLYFFLKKRTAKKAAIHRRMTELKLEALRSQMNPHFIYNCLNSIQFYLSASNSEAAKFYLNRFARLIRLTLDYSARNMISLAEELAYMETYMALEKMRFEEKLAYTIATKGITDATRIKLPPLLLQPYAENALRHGIKHGEGKVRIHYELREHKLYCSVDDNGIGCNLYTVKEIPEQKHGMQISSDRIASLNSLAKQQIECILTVKTPETDGETGTRVLLIIPLDNKITRYETV